MKIVEQPWFRKALVAVAARNKLALLERASRDLRGTQRALLERMLSSCRDTAYGREHHFGSIRTFEEYRAAVAIGDFETHRPYVERMMKGEPDVLFPGKPIIYNTTSGTTSKPKMVPISRECFENSITGMNKIWLHKVVVDNPRVYDGRSLSAVAPAEDGRVEDGTPYGSVSGLSYRNIPPVLKSTHSVPYAVICIRNYEKKFYAMMRHALMYNITYIISPSPSNMIRFHQTVLDNTESLLRDIHDGTLRTDVASEMAAEDRAPVLAALKPDHDRARELGKIFGKHGQQLRPRHYWPDIACINVWMEGNFRLMLPKLDGYFDETTVYRSFGYQASEARAGLVLANDWDYSVLAGHAYHYEFMEVSERGTASPRTVLAHEVEQGRQYHILFSNISGLYRYDINDIVEIIGFYNQLPLFRFVQKGEGVTSLTGEKLSEVQVIHAVETVTSQTGVRTEFYVMHCDEKDLRYRFYVEFAAGTSDHDAAMFTEAFDRTLSQYNQEYEVKRGSGRLHAPELRRLRQGAQEYLKRELIGRRMTTDGQYKEMRLTRKPVTHELLNAYVCAEAGGQTHAHQS